MKVLFTIAALVLLCSWQRASKTEVSKAAWLNGTWVSASARGLIYECWVPVNGNEFSGKSYMLKAGDTVVLESIRLLSEDERIYYIPTVAQQNKGLPVRFTATTVSAHQLVFENPGHDFPQRISYTLITGDSLLAEISGTRNGKAQRKLFPMKRVRE